MRVTYDYYKKRPKRSKLLHTHAMGIYENHLHERIFDLYTKYAKYD